VLFAHAHGTEASGDFKPDARSFGFELSCVPFSETAPIGINGIKFRYFTSPTTNFRFNFYAYSDNLSTKVKTSSTSTKDKTSSYFAMSLKPGLEKHFAGNQRLSPYIGAELLLGLSLASAKDGDDELTGMDGSGNRSGFSFGLGFVSGVDFYVYKGLYLGAEFGYGYSLNMQSEVEAKSGSSTTTLHQSATKSGVSTSVNTGIRIGYNF